MRGKILAASPAMKPVALLQVRARMRCRQRSSALPRVHAARVERFQWTVDALLVGVLRNRRDTQRVAPSAEGRSRGVI
jgi:hypothetical protein